MFNNLKRVVSKAFASKRPATLKVGIHWVTTLIFLTISAVPLGAQTGISATLSGVIVDPSGAVVPNAHVVLANQDQQFKQTVKTSDDGSFYITALRPGNYVLIAESTGFKTTFVNQIVLHANDTVALQVTLRIAGGAESVSVVDRPPLINESGAVSTTVDRQFIQEMPLDGRSIQSLITLSPGIQLAPVGESNEAGANPGQFSVNGMRSDANYFTVDGVSANFGASTVGAVNSASAGGTEATDISGSFANLVSVDDLEEIKIQTSTYAPEFGRSPGAQISMVTRSGEQRFHGALYDYFRNDALDATDWFSNYLGTRKSALRYNDFGGVFGGPVMLPKYDGRKHQSFFFFSYEGSRFVLPQPAQDSIVPSIDARQSAPTGIAQQILSSFPNPNGAILYTDSNLNPCSPGSTDCQPNGGALFASGFSNPSRSNVWSLRIDQNLGPKYTLFARYNHASSKQSTRQGGGLGDAAVVNMLSVPTQTLTIGTTQVFTSNLINQFTINGSTQSSTSSATMDNFGGAVPISNDTLLPSNSCPGCSAIVVIEGFTQANLFTQLQVANAASSRNRQINGIDNLSYRLRSHELKLGVDDRYLSPSTPGGATFANYYPNVQLLDANFNEFGYVSYSQRISIAFKTFSAYAQDTWKINPKLTLTYGSRWELDPPPTGRNGKDPLTIQSLNQNTLDFTYLSLAPAGTPLYKTSHTNFAPRIGFAYTGHTGHGHDLVLRGGLGIFYDSGQNLFGNINFPYTQSYFLDPLSGIPGYPALTLPVPAAYAQAPPPNLTPSPSNQASVTVATPGYKLPKVYEWNLTGEQSFGPSTVLSLAYVASLGHSLESVQQYLFAPPGTPLVPVSDNFSGLTVIGNQGSSNYNSLQAQLHSRFAKQFELIASYTWSHAIDNGSNDSNQFIPSGIANANLDHGDSDYDVRNSVTEALIYTIPSVSGHNPLRWLLKDWSVNDMLSVHTALPFNVEAETPSYLANGGYYVLRANTVPGQPQWIHGKFLPGTNSLVPGGRYLNSNAFTDPGSSAAQGTLGRNSLRGFGFTQLDFGLHRQFSITEKTHLQFRAEFFNIFNHPNFASPGMSRTNYVGYPPVGTPGFPLGFGEATESIAAGLGGGNSIGGFNPLFQQGGPRAIQLALRFEF